jgi:hypothetical protein
MDSIIFISASNPEKSKLSSENVNSGFMTPLIPGYIYHSHVKAGNTKKENRLKIFFISVFSLIAAGASAQSDSMPVNQNYFVTTSVAIAF